MWGNADIGFVFAAKMDENRRSPTGALTPAGPLDPPSPPSRKEGPR